MAGGVLESPGDLFNNIPNKAKGLHFDKKGQFINQAPGNYLIHHVENRTYYQEIGEDFCWDSQKKLKKFKLETYEPIEDKKPEKILKAIPGESDQEFIDRLKENPKIDLRKVAPVIPDVDFSVDESVLREELSEMKFPVLRKLYGGAVVPGTKKEELVDMIVKQKHVDNKDNGD